MSDDDYAYAVVVRARALSRRTCLEINVTACALRASLRGACLNDRRMNSSACVENTTTSTKYTTHTSPQTRTDASRAFNVAN